MFNQNDQIFKQKLQRSLATVGGDFIRSTLVPRISLTNILSAFYSSSARTSLSFHLLTPRSDIKQPIFKSLIAHMSSARSIACLDSGSRLV